MAHRALVGGTAYEIGGGKTLIGGTAYSIDKGKTLVGGTAYEVGFGVKITLLAGWKEPADYAYIVHNGVKYTAAYKDDIVFTAEEGDIITCVATSPPSNYNSTKHSIKINNAYVANVSGVGTSTYDYTVVSDVTIRCNYGIGKKQGTTSYATVDIS